MSELGTEVMAPGTGELSPVVDDLSIAVLPGRVQSSHQAIGEAVDAERLGFARLWHSERLSVKETGAVFGAIGASTSGINLTTCGTNPMARSPMATAGIFTSLQAMFGRRFGLGLGRGLPTWSAVEGGKQVTYDEWVEQAAMIAALWRGDSVAYPGSSGPGMAMVDRPAGPSPELWACSLVGGPKFCRAAVAPAFDGAVLGFTITPEVVRNSVARPSPMT